MTTVEVLEKAKTLLSNRERWTTHTFAKYDDGQPCPPQYATEDCSFCAVGALRFYGWKATDPVNGCYPPEGDQAEQYLQQAAGELYECSIVTVNDLMGYEAVMEVYDRAIALAEEATA